jgi:CHAT domain-containing protein/tetratricopeptide (TPR) repeat protein
MNKIYKKSILTLYIVAVYLGINAVSYSQVPVTSLVVQTPINSEITGGNSRQFTIKLSANQTARVEAEQTGADVSLTSYNPAGEKILEWGLPLGRVGSEEILVIAEETGEYRIEVTPGNRHRNYGEFVIKLIEVRETTEDDLVKDRAAKEISRIMPEAYRLARRDTASERRTAVKIWTEILKLSKVKEDKVAETRALNAIGRLFLDLGEFQKALDVQVQVLEGWRKLKNRRLEIVAAGRIAQIWAELGEYEKAIAAYIEGRKISREINSRIEEADNIINIGASYLLLKQPEKALSYFEQALPMYVEMKVSLLEASVLNYLGRTSAALGDYGTGIEYFQKALKLSQKKGFRGNIIQNNLDLGKAYNEIGDSGQAYEYLSQANSLASELGNQRYIVQTYYHLAIIESERGNLDKAIEHIEYGLKQIEKTRGELRNKALRTSYFSTVQNFYELYTDLLIERSKKNNNSADVELAFEMSERSRSRSLVDLLTEARVDFRQGVNAKLFEKEKDLTDAINSKYLMRERLMNRTPKPEQIGKINTEINNLEIELERLNLQIRRTNPRYANLTRGETLSTKEIQKLLDKETVLLEYKLGKKRSFVWAVTNNSINVYELPKRFEIETKARRFYELIVSNKKENAYERQSLSEHLSEVLLSKVKMQINEKRLVIVAEGMLQYLPFSALQETNKSFLVDKNETVILPSASVLAQLRENRSVAAGNNKTIAIFADPVFDKEDSRIDETSETDLSNQNAVLIRLLRDLRFDENLPRLLASRQEARNISKFVDNNKVSLQMGFDAKLENIENTDLSNYRILHFATHGLLNTSRPELSGLVFSLYNKNGQPQEGFLSLNDIYKLELSSDMVVLSACQTALGKDVRGEGLIGISRGFLYAGSKRIVASLWKVDDSATAEFMKLFYRNHLEKEMSEAAALRQAKLDMKKIPRYKSPFYWSAFTLLGEWK